MEALLLVYQFQSYCNLSQLLDTLLCAADELFNRQVSVSKEGGRTTVRVLTESESVQQQHQAVVPLGLGVLEAIVSGGQRYLAEFERLGLLREGGGALHDRSLVLSDISEGARASVRLRASSIDQVSRHTHLYCICVIHKCVCVLALEYACVGKCVCVCMCVCISLIFVMVTHRPSNQL